MSLRPDGTYHCDKCGADVGNGGVSEAAVVSTVDADDPTQPRVFHLCREPRDGAPRGCEGNVLGPSALANYYETRDGA